MIRNPEWYDLNEQRSWPLSDQATMIDDTGQRMPHRLLVDLNIWFPDIVGDFAFVGSITVSPKIATLTILGTTEAGPDIAPLAAVSVTAPIDPYRHYALQSFYPGVGGWVVFGSAVHEEEIFSYKFSTLSQSRLMPHVARSYRQTPIPNVGKLGALTPLTGLVRLTGGDDIEIVKESREIDSVVRDVAVIRLKSKPEFVEDVNLYEKYAGPCGTRPESNNCVTPPIEFINSVAPDCCGNITLEFRGCADVKFIQNESCSIAVGCHFGLSDACVTPDRLPDEDGRLPNEYQDLCISESIISSENAEGDQGVGPENVPFSIQSGFYVRPLQNGDLDNRLPYTEDFSNKDAKDFKTIYGRFDIVPDDEASLFGGYSMQSYPANKCLSIWKYGIPTSPTWSTLFRRATVHLSLRKGKVGILHNAGLVFNYNEADQSYWAIELDHEGTFTGFKGLRLSYNKREVSTTYAATHVRNMTLNKQYCLELNILPSHSITPWVTAILTNNEPPDSKLYVNHSIGPFLLPIYNTSNGMYGFTTYRAMTQFNRLVVENIES